MRESVVLRGALNVPNEAERREKAYCLRTPFFLSFSDGGFFRLMMALQGAGYPALWKEISDASKAELVSCFALRVTRDDLPVKMEEGAAEFDLEENCLRVGQLEPGELSLFKGREGRKDFVGFIRIEAGCSETEAVEAFRNEFRKRQGRRKGGGGAKWQARLNDLLVMRLSKQFRDHPIKLVEHVAKETSAGFKGCKEWWKEYCQAKAEKRYVERRISQAAHEEISHARCAARKFFQSLFPGEGPLNY
jgi:hypothetical protein